MIQQFKSLEYTSEDTFIPSEYIMEGNTETGWLVTRNGKEYLRVGKGYRLLKTVSCGVCSTDLARRFLPFPLPQIIGHEVIAEDVETGQQFVVEINDTPEARNESDIFSLEGIPTHSPGRMVLGIDRLPGGFGPYILAPVNALVPFGKIPLDAAVLVEPFAAALQAVISSPPLDGDKVAVLGPRRLGSLVIAALNAYRKSSKKSFHITALGRHENILTLAQKMGADTTIHVQKTELPLNTKQFDIVYDTTGSVDGFLLALKLAEREVHLKSTNGMVMSGLSMLTAFVVDELSLLPFTIENLDFNWPSAIKKNQTVYIAPGARNVIVPEGYAIYHGSMEEAEKILATEFVGKLPRFDVAIAGNAEEIDKIIRPSSQHENSLIRPRGAILYSGDPGDNPLLQFIQSGGALRSSRCGDFHLAVRLLEENPEVAYAMAENMISARFRPDDIANAFAAARDSNNVKIIVEHNG